MIFLKKLAKKFPRQNSIFNNDQLLIIHGLSLIAL